MNAAVIDQDGVVVNIVVIDDGSDYDPGEGLTLMPLDGDPVVRVGDQIADGEVVTPDPPADSEPDPSDPDPGQGDTDPVEGPPTIAEVAADVADLRDRFAALCAELGVDYAEGL